MIEPSDADISSLSNVIRDYIFDLKEYRSHSIRALEIIQRVTCNAAGYVCCNLSEDKKEELQNAIALLERIKVG